MDRPGRFRRSARCLVVLLVGAGLLVPATNPAAAQSPPPTQSFSVVRGVKPPGGYEVHVLAGSENPGAGARGPFVCAVAFRTTTTGTRRVTETENGCVFDPWQGTARYQLDPVTWTSTASGTFRTLVTVDVHDFVDGRWQRSSWSARWSKGTAALEWRGTGTSVVHQSLRPGVRVDREALASGRITFQGLGVTVTTSNQRGAVWFEAR